MLLFWTSILAFLTCINNNKRR
ncbi:hypothetical protein OIU26_04355 [Paenibacillus sp. BT-177]|uniref:Uncharacterized protein n=1 Tax=Paenibacillus polymyxa TaxID=1406 RepID=A0AAP3ZZ61_PAEPO|nr:MULTISPECIES: hypothetical protein [Paenibacillus]MCV9948534.1 hypothetical protein [Paenibacillus sp. BT-177]MDH2332183.1 hypothetical protein [Paenibacillus polymyxa]WCM63987.1 hypothetical protein OYT09_17905 [Paenibacillus polymyxa]